MVRDLHSADTFLISLVQFSSVYLLSEANGGYSVSPQSGETRRGLGKAQTSRGWYWRHVSGVDSTPYFVPKQLIRIQYRMRLGYQGINRELRESGIMTDRTARVATVKEKGIGYLKQLYSHNLRDLLEILKWNVAHDILFYRVSSGIAPHITNDVLLEAGAGWKDLVYDLHCSAAKEIKDYVAENGIRITFHAEPFVVLSAKDDHVRERSMRDIYYHYKLMQILGLGHNSVVIVHGGGLYGDKAASILRWKQTYLELGAKIRRRVVLENDEYCFNIEDVLEISEQLPGLPVVLDIFHYACHQQVRSDTGLPPLPPLVDYLPRVIASWERSKSVGGADHVKMHISEQRPDAPLGTHSDYVESMPDWMLKFPQPLDVMVETKLNEKAVMYLRERIGSQSVSGGAEDRVYAIGPKSWAKKLKEEDSSIIIAKRPDDIINASVIIAHGNNSSSALAYQSKHYMLRGIVLDRPEQHLRVADNVIVHGDLPLGAERYYAHVVDDDSVESIVESAHRLAS